MGQSLSSCYMGHCVLSEGWGHPRHPAGLQLVPPGEETLGVVYLSDLRHVFLLGRECLVPVAVRGSKASRP